MVQRLKSVTKKMTQDERRLFEMMEKRDHDDEELDSLTLIKLKQIYIKYFPKNSKAALEDKWKKLTGEQKDQGELS